MRTLLELVLSRASNDNGARAMDNLRTIQGTLTFPPRNLYLVQTMRHSLDRKCTSQQVKRRARPVGSAKEGVMSNSAGKTRVKMCGAQHEWYCPRYLGRCGTFYGHALAIEAVPYEKQVLLISHNKMYNKTCEWSAEPTVSTDY